MRIRIDLGDKEKKAANPAKVLFWKRNGTKSPYFKENKENCQKLTIASRMLPKHSGVPRKNIYFAL
jgi:hypothetical protein